MGSNNSELNEIKNKILLSTEIEKKTHIVKKGKDYWCCCLFHKEKTPSMKINDELGSYYCFGCGAKGDIFNLYTELYNYTFQDSIKELAQRVGITLKYNDHKQISKNENILKILESAKEWFCKNLDSEEATICRNYLAKRNLSKKTILKFNLGYSYNSKSNLYSYLKSKSFKDEEIIKSNLIKLDKDNKPKDYFYKRLIFPIRDDRSQIVGFGGRSINNSEPKYINSPESDFFQKRFVLYNLSNAKNSSRKKNNLLICEGYMDVIALYEKGIESVVAPLGTALTQQQLHLSWKYCSKPTIMFDGDNAGLKAAYKSALMSLENITPKKLIQFILLPIDEDPDSYINKISFKDFINLLNNPIPIVDFIFYQASKSYSLNKVDDKIIFDKFIDDIVKLIKDSKIKYFYRNEFKSLFFKKIKNSKKNNTNINIYNSSLYDKQLCSYIAAFFNHPSIRKEIAEELINSELLIGNLSLLLKELSKPEVINKQCEDLSYSITNKNLIIELKNCLKSEIYQLFPYASADFSSDEALVEIQESCNNLKTRLLNLEKINKSLDSFNENTDTIKWDEIQKIRKELTE